MVLDFSGYGGLENKLCIKQASMNKKLLSQLHVHVHMQVLYMYKVHFIVQSTCTVDVGFAKLQRPMYNVATGILVAGLQPYK